MTLCKVVAVMCWMQLLARSAAAQATAFAAAGDASALAAAGGSSALAAAGTSAGYNSVYVQPILTAFTSSKAWDAANAVAVALKNNQAASILQAVSQAKASNVQPVVVCDSYNYGLKLGQAVGQVVAEAIAKSYGGGACKQQSGSSGTAVAAASAGK
ncbi:hypothetical protein ABBQ32_013464 [Trebouxia sp. C0010 RCD-2024]